jgi:hypothetical protein
MGRTSGGGGGDPLLVPGILTTSDVLVGRNPAVGTAGLKIGNGGAFIDDANSTGNLIRMGLGGSGGASLAVNGANGPITITNAGFNRKTITRAASYTLTATDDTVVFTVGAGQTATLPSATVALAGRRYVVVNASASTSTLALAATAGTVPVATIAAGSAIEVVSDGTNWQAA